MRKGRWSHGSASCVPWLLGWLHLGGFATGLAREEGTAGPMSEGGTSPHRSRPAGPKPAGAGRQDSVQTALAAPAFARFRLVCARVRPETWPPFQPLGPFCPNPLHKGMAGPPDALKRWARAAARHCFMRNECEAFDFTGQAFTVGMKKATANTLHVSIDA